MSISTSSDEFMNSKEVKTIDKSITSSKNSATHIVQDSIDLKDILFAPSTVTSHTSDKEFESDVQATPEELSMTLLTRQSNNDLRRQQLKRKISPISQQQVVPLSERLQQERGEIDTGEGSSLMNESSETISILAPKSLQLSDSPTHSPSLKLDLNIERKAEDIPHVTEKQEISSDLQEVDLISDSHQEGTSVLTQDITDETSLSDFASQKSLKAILQLQMQIWRKLLKLKQSTQILERSYSFNPASEPEKDAISNENAKSSAVTIENKVQPTSLFNSSLRVVCSQLDTASTDSMLVAGDLPRSTMSCYKKMNVVQNRLADVEFRIASIHDIIEAALCKHYRELKASVGQKLEKMPILNPLLDHQVSGNTLDVEMIAMELKSDPPVTQYESSLFGQVLNPYDENYYDWRQNHMNRMHYKKSERTIALNKRPILRILRPPVLKMSGDNSNRAKKPYFVNTPSRINQ